MCFKHTPPINVGLEKILVEIINVAEMVRPFLLEFQEGNFRNGETKMPMVEVLLFL